MAQCFKEFQNVIETNKGKIMQVKWNDPETKLPEDKQVVLIKTKYLHTQKVKVCRYDKDSGFMEKENPTATHDPSQVWGWVEFNDTDKKE